METNAIPIFMTVLIWICILPKQRSADTSRTECERSQKGRFRDFWQFGIESIGSDRVDAEGLLKETPDRWCFL